MKKSLLVAIFSLITILALSACGWFQEPQTAEDLSVRIGTEKTDTKAPVAVATTTTDTTVTPDATTTIDNTPADLHPEKARDALRKADTIKIMTSIYVLLLNGSTLPETNCTSALSLNIASGNPVDPSKQGPDASMTGGLDCTSSYYYVNKIQSSSSQFGIYAKIETPTGNIDCANLGTDKVITDTTTDTGLYCYAILGK